MRLGADAGRDFLSTKDPVGKDTNCSSVNAGNEANAESGELRFGAFHRILKQFCFRKVEDR